MLDDEDYEPTKAERREARKTPTMKVSGRGLKLLGDIWKKRDDRKTKRPIRSPAPR